MKVRRQALVTFSSEQMYDLVLDVCRYPEFLPWCTSGVLLDLTPSSQVARLTISRSGIAQSFTTRNALRHPEEIALELVEGPFRSLNGSWRFQSLGREACKVSLDLEFEPLGALAGMALGGFFGQAANAMVDLFCKRAQQIYKE